MSVLEQVREWLRGDRRAPRNVLADLAAAYRDEVEAAAQLRAHAERVPYAQAAVALRRLADAEDAHALDVRRKIAALGGTLPQWESTVPEGVNHWDRMADAYHRADAKRRRYIELSVQWDIEHPDVAGLFSRLAAEETAHRRILEELVIRADSLALD